MCMCFNRTFMELKHLTRGGGIIRVSGFNRTFMELKHVVTQTALQA